MFYRTVTVNPLSGEKKVWLSFRGQSFGLSPESLVRWYSAVFWIVSCLACLKMSKKSMQLQKSRARKDSIERKDTVCTETVALSFQKMVYTRELQCGIF